MELRLHQKEAVKAIEHNIKGIINLPTGTGKTFIQSYSIANDIINSEDKKVYVVLAPIILLADQLFKDIRTCLVNKQIDVRYLTVHSGNNNINSDVEWLKALSESGLGYRDIESTTSTTKIKEVYEKSKIENIPLVIVGTYESAKRISESGIPVEILFCDEAHHLVSKVDSENIGHIWIPLEFISNKKFFFTATMKVTPGTLGMNNTNLFGGIIYQKLPAEMIQAGEIIRPRMHWVDFGGITDNENSPEDRDAKAICEAFKQHRTLLAAESSTSIAPKLLVVAQGSEHLDNISNHPEIKQLEEDRDNLTIFDISTAFEPRINGQVVNRKEWLDRIKSLTDQDEAIIIHVRILKEGIDVPGITGVMPLNNLKKSDFLQTLGRATRLHKKDRTKLYSGLIQPDNLTKFTKPYAWIITPEYGELGSEISENFIDMIEELRSFGFAPKEDIFVKTSKGQVVPVPIDQTNELDERTKKFKKCVDDVVHRVEDREICDKINVLKDELVKISFEEKIRIGI